MAFAPNTEIHKLTYYLFAQLGLIMIAMTGYGQAKTSAKTSDAVVVYDKILYQPATGSVIPFDKRFTLQIPHGGSPNITKVYVYKASFDGGARDIVGDRRKPIFPDFDLPFKVSGDTLNIYFPAIEPQTSFEVAVVSSLNGSLTQMAAKLSEDIYNNDNTSAITDFQTLQDSAIDNAVGITYFQYRNNLPRYQLFYALQLSAIYNQLHNPGSYRVEPFPGIADINTLEAAFAANHLVFKDDNRLVRVLAASCERTILDGRRTMKYDNTTAQTPDGDFVTRMGNLQASLVFFDTLTNTINASLAINDNAAIRLIRDQVDSISVALRQNKKLIHDGLDNINTAITANTDLSAVDVLIGSTVAKDIKTAGGNIITMDLGLTNILTRDVQSKLVYIPKPYYGINIYFRPIDKNTREKDFPRRIAKGGNPQYRFASVNDPWMHLSFGVGLTFTPMTNSQFDNLFNSATLLLGPGYRIGRFVKIGTGLALMRRISKDPLISDKKVTGGYYLSMSADIDVVQGIKDFIQMIFK